MREDVHNFVTNMLTVDKPFVLPRAVRSYVAPHKVTYKIPVVPALTTTVGALIVRPNLETFLQTAEVTSTAAVPLVVDQNSVDWSWNANDQGSGICIDVPFSLGPGVIKSTSLVSALGFTHFSDANNQLKTGFKYYEGVFNLSAADFSVSVSNPDNSTMSVQILFYSIGTDGNLSAPSNGGVASFVVPGNDVGSALYSSLNTATWRTNVLAGKGFAIVLQVLNASTIGRVPHGFTLSLSGNMTIASAGALVWKNYSFFDISPASGTILRSQYQLATRHCTTGLISTFTNCSNQFAKGGQIWAAQLPGDSFSLLPGSATALKAFLGERQQNALVGVDLSDGASWSYTPEKIQDWFFQQKAEIDPYNGNPFDLPYFCLAYDLSGIQTGSYQAVFDLHGAIMYEYITTDISSMQVLPECDVIDLLKYILMELPAQNHVTSNPHHLKDIWNKATDFVKSPAGRALIKKGLEIGAETLLPMLLL